ncbi:hypothetical protein Acr_00g0090920 [Actinidia rufa]|uniref:Ankyrin repeat family protein n=1 Tax=Actinidia rufa TaxID=165716 RepID=A0A7J0DZH6_9ERIC|nr:hypothetical protein Acr_00g0090920 [Actinidia rufa]
MRERQRETRPWCGLWSLEEREREREGGTGMVVWVEKNYWREREVKRKSMEKGGTGMVGAKTNCYLGPEPCHGTFSLVIALLWYQEGGTLVCHAIICQNPDVDVVSFLLDAGDEFDAVDEEKCVWVLHGIYSSTGPTGERISTNLEMFSLLHFVAGTAEASWLLIMAGGDISVKSRDGQSCSSELRVLHFAAGIDLSTLVQLLKMWFSLNSLAKGSHADACKLLSQRGADSGIVKKMGRTALLWLGKVTIQKYFCGR